MPENRDNVLFDEPMNQRDCLAESQNSTVTPSSPRRGRWAGRVAILIAALITLGPVVYFGLPAEIARWHVAAGMEMWENGRRQEALAQLEAALRWTEDNPDIYVCRADWWLNDGQYEKALEDYNRALALEPNHFGAFVQRCEAYQHLGRHAEAIRDWKELVARHQSASGGGRAVLLNGLAYAQSLDTSKKPELDKALENIIQAINLAGQNPRVGQDAAMLDTRGYIHYRRGNLAAAEVDLNLAVNEMEKQLNQEERTRHRREFNEELEMMRKSLAVIRYHRALVFDALGKSKEAEADRRRVRELGFVPAPSLF